MTMSLEGQKILITGGNSGIGFEAAKAFIALGAQVIIAARPSHKTEMALHALGSSASHIPVDLADLTSVRQLATTYLERHETLDVLVNNAGLFPAKQQLTEQGFEMQFGVNHLSHFLLTQLLLPMMIQHGHARVVTVSSMLHKKAKLDFNSFKGDSQYNAQKAYGQSKLANVLFAYELAERLAHTQVTSNVLHPGGVATDIVRDMPWLIRALLGLIFISPEKGAKTTVMLGADPTLTQTTGTYFDQCKEASPTTDANNLVLRQQLWEYSLTATGLTADHFEAQH